MEKPSLKSVKDKLILEYIEYLEKQLKIFTESSYVNSYLSIKTIVDTGNKQIAEKVIDIFTPEGQKDHQSITKFGAQLQKYEEQMESFRAKMNPQQQRELDARIKENNLGTAEKIALHGRS